MTPFFVTQPVWRRVASSVALAASLTVAVQPSLSLAQVQVQDPDRPPTLPKAPRAPKKAAPRETPTDNVSDDLNRREAERAAAVVASMSSPTAVPAAMQVPGTQPRLPIERASLTAGAEIDAPASAQPPQLVQAQAPSPIPVPIQPSPTAGQPATGQVLGAPGRPFGQSEVVPTEAPTLTLEVNKGTALKLPGPAATVFVAAPDIADVQVRSPTMVYVFAKKAGDTVLYAVDGQDRVLLNTIVRVTSPLSRVKGALDAVHPGNGITFDNQGETIVLGGTSRSAVIVEDARRLALQQVNNNPNRVISNVQLDAPTQVQLRVKVAEVKRDSLKRVGINWQNINSIALFGTGNVLAGFAVNTIQSTGGTISIPAIRTRTAATTIELGSGQSFAIAGLLQSSSLQDIVKFPWLGDVPVLGTLFKSDAYQRSETELVIIITPYFVEGSNSQLQTPLTGRVPPTDVDRLVMQRFNHPTPPRRLSVGRETTTTSAGFKLD